MLRWLKRQKVFVKICSTTFDNNGNVTRTILHLGMIVMAPKADMVEGMVLDMGRIMEADMDLITVAVDMEAITQAMDQVRQQMHFKARQLLQGLM